MPNHMRTRFWDLSAKVGRRSRSSTYTAQEQDIATPPIADEVREPTVERPEKAREPEILPLQSAGEAILLLVLLKVVGDLRGDPNRTGGAHNRLQNGEH